MKQFSFSETVPVTSSATAAGTKVTERIAAPSSASSTVSAIGVNIFPSTPVEREDRQVDDRDDQRAEQARPDHLAGAVEDRLEALAAASAGGPCRCCSSASRRRQFSTMITAPSTMMPKSMRAEAHQVGADPVLDHAGDGEQHRQRNHAAR